MDAVNLDALVDSIAFALGFEATSLLALFAVLSLVCRLVGKFIPDDATGTLGVIRRVCKVIGLYVGNRVTRNVSTNDAARAVADSNRLMNRR